MKIFAVILAATCLFGQINAEVSSKEDDPTFLPLPVKQGLAPIPIKNLDAKWEEFKAKHNKNYSPEEENMRKMNFAATLGRIASMNQQRDFNGQLGITHFADYSQAEKEQMLGLKLPKDLSAYPRFTSKSINVSASPTDWRTKGAVLQQVKNQGSCGSCWAFACASALESAWQINKGAMQSLSEQDFLDCSGGGDCDGGNPFAAYTNIANAKAGIVKEECYPYEEEFYPMFPFGVGKGVGQGFCRADTNCAFAYPTGIQVMEGLTDIETYVATKGPVVGLVSVDSGRGWFDYKGPGLYKGPCADDANHAVTIVGFTDDAWIIRNSWGDDWGVGGYMLLAKGDNTCHVEGIAVAPTV